MLYKNHYLEIYINGELLELKSQADINLRLNNVLYEPTEIGSNQAEYSFSFEIPSTPNNDKIFDYANDLAKPNKYHIRRKAEVYADGHLIFNGTLLVNGFKDKQYSCNLVSVKVYSLEDIFGEAKLTDLPYDEWNKEFNGVSSINAYNATGGDVMFPLISYGVFQKSPKYSDEIANDYTPKHDIDKYNRWWVESFYPSLNMLSTIKHFFNWKGYNVAGDAFNDDWLNNIYMSCNLASEQIPTYNLGNPLMGKLDISTRFITMGTSGYAQELQFPYYKVQTQGGAFGGAGIQTNVQTSGEKNKMYNFNEINLYDLLSSGTVTHNSDSYMFDPGEKCIVIPADGFYKINMRVSATLNISTPTFTAAQWLRTEDGRELELTSISGISKNLWETCPIEVQLVRNYEDDVELIKGKWNKVYTNGNPTQTQYKIGTRWYNNVTEWQTCFPHEDPYQSTLPTETNELGLRNTYSVFGGQRNYGGTTSSSTRGGGFGSGRNTGGTREYRNGEFGYVYNDNTIMAYDQAVNDNFICGFSSMGVETANGVRAVKKNGYSWSKTVPTLNEEFYEQAGYTHLFRGQNSTGDVESEPSTVNQNTYPRVPSTYFNSNRTTMNGTLSCMVWLNKNDILELFQVNRAYEDINGNPVFYGTDVAVDLQIEAASPRSYAMLRSVDYGYNNPSEFDTNLRISNFMNQETTISSFIQSLLDAFNIEMIQEGKNIWLNTKKSVVNNLPAVVDLDNRANSSDAETQNIEYPSSMAIKYKIDTEEYGYWLTVPEERRNEDDWKEYGDSGYTVIQLSDDDYNVESEEKSLSFSYTWYDNFNWIEVDSANTENSGNTTILTMPVISNYTYMAEGYSYDESMKHDGYSLAQRFWFKPKQTNAFVWTDSYPYERADIYIPENTYNGLNLSYKTNETSLLGKYFNLRPYLTSNYVIINVYLTPEEYKAIKNGGNVKFDDELYSVTEINGYDPTGSNLTELKLLKLV